MYTIENKETLIQNFRNHLANLAITTAPYSTEGLSAIFDYIEDQQIEYAKQNPWFKFWCGLTYTDIRIIFNETDIENIEDVLDGYDDDSTKEFDEFLVYPHFKNRVLSNGEEVIKIYEMPFKNKLKSIITVNLDNH